MDPTFRRVATNGITLNVAEAGPEDGPLVLLLHGFPESWYGWKHQIGPLAEAGFRVMAPDQRGYTTSDKPKGIAAYALGPLIDDVLGLIDSTGRARATVIGHDWGGVVAWGAIARHPDRFDRAVILNAPHPEVMGRELRSDFRQMLRSWYAFAFQVPMLPERMLARHNFRALARGIADTSRPGTFSQEDLDRYRKGWAEPGALTGMVNWYRAGVRRPAAPPADPIVRVPTLILWGMKDRFLGEGLARASYAQCRDARIEWIEEATHWVQHEEPARVNAAILAFIK